MPIIPQKVANPALSANGPLEVIFIERVSNQGIRTPNTTANSYLCYQTPTAEWFYGYCQWRPTAREQTDPFAQGTGLEQKGVIEKACDSVVPEAAIASLVRPILLPDIVVTGMGVVDGCWV